MKSDVEMGKVYTIRVTNAPSAPNDKMSDVLNRTVSEAKSLISRELVKRGQCMDKATVKEALMMLSGAVTIVYPMGLPPYDPIKLELDNEEDLSGTQVRFLNFNSDVCFGIGCSIFEFQYTFHPCSDSSDGGSIPLSEKSNFRSAMMVRILKALKLQFVVFSTTLYLDTQEC